MEGEIKNFIKVWSLAISSFCYCYYISSTIHKGLRRLISLLPVFYLFILLPFNLSSINLCGPTAFFLVWLGNFKLLLFSFDQGPLSPPPKKLFHFISIACLPIKIKQNPKNPKTLDPHRVPKLILLVAKTIILGLIYKVYKYRHFLPNYLLIGIYCIHVYLQVEIVLALCATPAKLLFGFELEPQFNEPYLATSLQDFWGRRWNLMVTRILRPTIYDPTKQISRHVVGERWAVLPAIVATFVVSGLMHEIIYYYFTRVTPTWEVTWFFVLHGFCLVVEVVVKKIVRGRWRLSPVVSGPATLAFVVVTAAWLFFPQLLRNDIEEKVIREVYMFGDFVKDSFTLILRNRS